AHAMLPPVPYALSLHDALPIYVLEAEMPVDTRTHQPFGLLHGGASAALAETLGSMAGFMMTRDGQCVVGTELNATHHRPVSDGRSEEHTSELQSRFDLVCRLLL